MSVDLGAVELADVVRYSGASGDLNPLHYDRDFARAAGYDDIFSMGALHGGWLVSQACREGALPLTGACAVRLRFSEIVPLGRPLHAESESSPTGSTHVLTMDGRPVVTATIQSSAGPPGPADRLSSVQSCSFPVELGSARRFGLAVRWPLDIASGTPVPPTFLSVLSFFLPEADPIERVEMERSRTLLGQTTIELYAGPMRVGETFEVEEFVTNRRTKTGSRGTLELADLVAELRDDSGPRVKYTNTFVLTAEAEHHDPLAGHLQGSRDPMTGEVFFPRRALSVDGSLRELEDVELSREGTLWSWTTYDGRAFGQVDLPEGVRVQGPLEGTDHEIGATYRLWFGPRDDWWFARA